MDEMTLHLYYGNKFREFDLADITRDAVSIGSDLSDDIYIASPAVGVRHAYLEYLEDRLYISNPAALPLSHNGRPVSRQPVNPGDIFIFGSPEDPNCVVMIAQRKGEYSGSLNYYKIKGLDQITIGRDESNNIAYQNLLVSKNHARFTRIGDESQWQIEDLSSNNGIYVNGERVTSLQLAPGDIIHVAGYRIVFDEDSLGIENVGSGVRIVGLSQLEKTRSPHIFFQRSPRMEPDVPRGEVEMPRPPARGIKPNINWAPILVMPILMICVFLLMVIFMPSGMMMLLMMPMAVGSVFVGVLNYNSQKKKYGMDEGARSAMYQREIVGISKMVDKLRQRQQKTVLFNHPDPVVCQNFAANRNRRLWERTPDSRDFLSLRMGKGTDVLQISIKPPRAEMNIDPDPLIVEAYRLAKQYRNVPDSPICAPLGKDRVIGVAGARPMLLQTMRNMVMQLATHHSYDEVKIVALFPYDESEEWEWMRWLPHVWDESRRTRYLLRDKIGAQRILEDLQEILRGREDSAKDPINRGKFFSPHYVFIIADNSLVEGEAIMRMLANAEAIPAVSILYLNEKIEMLPRDCKQIVRVDNYDGQITPRESTANFRVFKLDRVSHQEAENFARLLAPVRLRLVASPNSMPEYLPFLAMFDADGVEALHAAQLWEKSQPERSLAAVVGVKGGGKKMMLDIHDKFHGPHGLVAGTTGSGKSELLQSLILSLGINYHPYDVSFVLVDYKGGGMANLFKGMPHLAGIITNLGGNETNRALLSLQGELKRRQRLFDQYSVNNIQKYQHMYRTDSAAREAGMEPLPHLVLVVDEFAELKAEQPQFMSELVSAARIGRTLGIHLILATQKPSGVVDTQIWSNARFRISLRVQERNDSMEVLKRPDAAFIKIPGRAYMQVGNDEVFELFQSAYSGAEYIDKNSTSRNAQREVFRLELDGSRRQFYSSVQAQQQIESYTQLQAVIEYLARTAEENNIIPLPQTWLPPLPELFPLAELATLAPLLKKIQWSAEAVPDMAAIVGRIDNPSGQEQPELALNFGSEGHYIIYGAPASGKTTTIYTIVLSLALTHSPEDFNAYIIDFGGRTLRALGDLPHVGDVVMVDESEKFKKLLRMLLKEMDRRKELFASASVGSAAAWRQSTGKKIPSILVAIDNYAAMGELYPDAEEQFVQVAREGGNLGVHLLITGNSAAAVRYRMTSNIKAVLTLQLADKSEYTGLVGRPVSYPPNLPGRGLVRGNPPLECQVALPVAGASESERADALKEMVKEVAAAWKGAVAKPIPMLPERLLPSDIEGMDAYKKIVQEQPYFVPLGVEVEDLEIAGADGTQSSICLIAGGPQSGKTTVLKNIIGNINKRHTPETGQVFVVDSMTMPLIDMPKLPVVTQYAGNGEEWTEMYANLVVALDEQKAEMTRIRSGEDENGVLDAPFIWLVIDDLAGFLQLAQADDKQWLENIIRRERGLKFQMVVAGQLSDLNAAYENLSRGIKEMQQGLLLSDFGNQQTFNIRLPFQEVNRQGRVGDAYHINRGVFKRLRLPIGGF